MSTVTKSVRVDERFLVIVEDYIKLSKDMMGVAPTVSSVLSSTLVEGFQENLRVYRMLLAANMITVDDGQNWNDDIKARAENLIERWEMLNLEVNR